MAKEATSRAMDSERLAAALLNYQSHPSPPSRIGSGVDEAAPASPPNGWRDWRSYVGPQAAQGLENVRDVAGQAANYLGFPADVKGGLEDFQDAGAAFNRGDIGTGLGHTVYAGLSPLGMMIPGTIRGIRKATEAAVDPVRAKLAKLLSIDPSAATRGKQKVLADALEAKKSPLVDLGVRREFDNDVAARVGAGQTLEQSGGVGPALGSSWFRKIKPDTLPMAPADRGRLLGMKTTRTNSDRVAAQAVNEGIIPPQARRDAIDFLDGRAAAHNERLRLNWAQKDDPLSYRKENSAINNYNASKRLAAESAEAQQLKLYNANELEKIKSIDHGGMWNKKFSDEILSHNDYQLANESVNRANMEAIPRTLKTDGWQVRHASIGNDGRKSSRYVVSPDGKYEVRISDHYIPETPQREFRNTGSRWNDEIILNGRESPQDILNQIRDGYRRFMDEQEFSLGSGIAGLLGGAGAAAASQGADRSEGGI